MKRWITRLDVVALSVSAAVLALVALLTQQSDPRRIGPAVAFLYPALGGVQNVWLAPIENPSAAEQVSFAPLGIYDFGVSPDGTYIAYSERTAPSGLHEIMLLNLNTRQVTQVTQCVAENADCRTPVFHPSRRVIAYERVSANTGIGTGVGVVRIWLADISRQPYETLPLSSDSQMIGYGPEWSLDGSTLAFYSSDIASPGILVYHFNPTEGAPTLKYVPSQYGTVGGLSPDGQRLVFPDMYRRADGQVYSFLRIADLEGLDFVNFTNPEDEVDDIEAVWHPDGTRVTIVRRYTDDRFTRGYQLYNVDVSTLQAAPLLVDPAYSHGFFSYDSSGQMIVLQRFPFDPQTVAGSSPQVWALEAATGRLTLISDNAFHPRWVYGVDTP